MSLIVENIIEEIKNTFAVDIFKDIIISNKFFAPWVICQNCKIVAIFISDIPPKQDAIFFTEYEHYQKDDISFFYDNENIYYVDYLNSHGTRRIATKNDILGLFSGIIPSIPLYQNCKQVLSILYDFGSAVFKIKYPNSKVVDLITLLSYLKIQQLSIPCKKGFLWDFDWVQKMAVGEIKKDYYIESDEGIFKMNFSIRMNPLTMDEAVRFKNDNQLHVALEAKGYWRIGETHEHQRYGAEKLFLLPYCYNDEPTKWLNSFDENRENELREV